MPDAQGKNGSTGSLWHAIAKMLDIRTIATTAFIITSGGIIATFLTVQSIDARQTEMIMPTIREHGRRIQALEEAAIRADERKKVLEELERKAAQ